VVGKPYWVTARLFEFAAQGWRTIDGLSIAEGVDLLAVLRRSPSRFLNAIWVLWLRTAKDEMERNKIEFQLKAPPPWQKKVRVAEQQTNANNFMAAMGSLQSIQGADS
jgi:hypothetical protein